MTRKPRKTAESVGERFKRDSLELFAFNPAEHLLLDCVVAVADALVRINAEVAAATLTTTGSTGQRVAEPLLREQREHAARLTALIEAIRLPGPDEAEGRSSTSLSAQRAALTRWAKEKAA
jgi:hypothetical protein